MAIEVQTLGGFDVVIDGQSSPLLKRRPTCSAVLVYVAIERKVTRDSVLAAVWPERSETRARHALSQTLYQLRRVLGRDQLPGMGQELRLADDVRVDAAEFEIAVRERRFAEAAQLYDGRFLENWHFRSASSFQHWVDRQAERLASLHRRACRHGVASLVEAGNGAGARALAERWVEAEPGRSEAHVALIGLLIDDGDHESALEHYAALEKHLATSGRVPRPEVAQAIAPVMALRATALPSVRDRPTAARPRIAVLPFAHAGPSRYKHLTYGLADETTVRLSAHPDIAVIARSSTLMLAEQARSLVEIGNELNADYVLDGTVRWRPAGASVSAVSSPQLVRVIDGKQLWAAQLESDGEGIGNMHVRLADHTLSALGLRPLSGGGQGEAREPPDPAAWELYVRGLQHWQQRSVAGLDSAIDLFIQAIERDDEYAKAYAGLAMAYAMRPSFLGEASATWMPRAKRAAQRALELDPDSAEGHLAMGLIAWSHDLDADSAGRHWDSVLHLNPSTAQAMMWQAYRSAVLQRRDEARQLVGQALALDPLSVSTNFDAGLVLWHVRDRTDALEQMRRVLQLDPSFTPAAFMIGAHHLQRGEIDDTRREWSRVNLFGPLWATLLERLDDPPQALLSVDRIVQISPSPVHWFAIAYLYVLLGAPERAFTWIEVHLSNVRGQPAAYATGGPSLFHAAVDPTFDTLRDSPRFKAFLHALRLDTAAR